VPVYITNIHTREASNALTRLHPPATVALRPFATDATAVRHIRVRIARPQPGRLELEYELQGDLAALRIAPPDQTGDSRGPTEGLWRHTCMEVFAAQALPGPYLEFNLAPSGQWAAYRFSGYRADMAPLTGIRPPRIELRTQADWLLLSADVELPADLGPAGLHLGLTAVVEDAQGLLSYWALAHTGDRPDFHHPASFSFEI
jgi:hypothetical protein